MAARVVHAVAVHGLPPSQVLGLTFTNKAAGELAHRVRGALQASSTPGDPAWQLPGQPSGPAARTPRCPVARRPADRRDLPRLRRLARARPRPAHRPGARGRRCSPRRAAGRSRRGWCAPSTGRCVATRCSPRTLAAVPARPRRGDVRAPGAPRRTCGPWTPRCSPPSRRGGEVDRGDPRRRRRRRRARGAARRWWSATGERKRERGPARLRRPGGARGAARGGRPPRSPRGSGAGSGWCCSTSTRTPGSPSGGCSPRCSATATRSPRWVTPARASTAGGAPRPATCCASPSTSPAPTAAGARPEYLLTSFRNGGRVLAAANRLSETLRGPPPGGARGPWSRCRRWRRRRAGRGVGRVEVALVELTADDEAALARRTGSPRRSRAGHAHRARWPCCAAAGPTSRPLHAALAARGVPAEVVGLGGLLTLPEVADVVAVLRVLADPTANPSMLRLLTGPRWRIGPRDLAALGRRAARLAPVPGPGAATAPDADGSRRAAPTPPTTATRSSWSPSSTRWTTPARRADYSPEAWPRLRALRAELRSAAAPGRGAGGRGRRGGGVGRPAWASSCSPPRPPTAPAGRPRWLRSPTRRRGSTSIGGQSDLASFLAYLDAAEAQGGRPRDRRGLGRGHREAADRAQGQGPGVGRRGGAVGRPGHLPLDHRAPGLDERRQGAADARCAGTPPTSLRSPS